MTVVCRPARDPRHRTTRRSGPRRNDDRCFTTSVIHGIADDARDDPATPLEARRGPLLPALIFTIIVTQLPFLVTIAISTLHWNVLQPGPSNFLGLGNYDSFAGLKNYATVFTDDRLRTAVINTIVLTAAVVIVSVLIGLGLAILLDRKFPGRGLARTLLIAPFLVMPVASALLWKHALYNPDYGLFNGVLNWIWHLFGAGEGPVIDYVSSTPMPAVIAALVWQWTPFMMLILLAGLAGPAR